MATVLVLVTDALLELGVLSDGESPSASQGAHALRALNRMVGQWANEPLLIYTVTRTTWTISASDGTYTVGTSGDVNVDRPLSADRINQVNYIDTSTDPDQEYPLIKLTEDGYAAITEKALTSTLPTHWYYNPTLSTGTLNLWPVPTSSSLQGALYAREQISSFAALSTTVTLPDGYEELIVTNLAVALASTYTKPPDPLLLQRARDAKALIKRTNRREMDMCFDPGALVQTGLRRYNIYTE